MIDYNLYYLYNMYDVYTDTKYRIHYFLNYLHLEFTHVELQIKLIVSEAQKL